MKFVFLVLSIFVSVNANDINSTMLIGTNALFWEETDSIRAKPGYIKTLKKLHIKTMRFPGGEVADNYDWRTNTLNDPNKWPYSTKASDAEDSMDFDEFMQLQKKLGSEPVIVVNLENGFITGNLEEAANIAAEWVRYANIEKGYKIKYWEIGNESYQIQSMYPLTAKEYAKAFNLFTEKMKQVDPSIKIGANGPSGFNAVALLDKLSILEQIKVRKEKNNAKRQRIAKNILLNKRSIEKKIWWEILLSECNNTLDFIALHYYIHIRKTDMDKKKPLYIQENLSHFSSYTKNITKKDIPIFITEWNISKQSTLNIENYVYTVNEAVNEFRFAGIKMIHFWPLRITVNHKFKSMFQLDKEKMNIINKKISRDKLKNIQFKKASEQSFFLLLL